MTIREAAGQAALAILLAFLGSEAGGHFFPLEALLAGLGLILVHRCLPEAESRPRLPFFLPALAGFALICRWPHPATRLALLALVWSAGALTLPRNDRRRERLEAAAAVTLLVCLFRVAGEISAWFRLGYEEGVLVLTEGIGRVAGTSFRGGPAAAGAGLLVPFLALAAVEAGRRTGGRRLGRWIPAGALLLTWSATLAVLPRLQPAAWSSVLTLPHGERDPAADWFRIAPPLFLLALGLCWILFAPRLGSPTRGAGRPALPFCAAVLIAALLLLPAWSRTGNGPSGTRVLILGSEILDFRTPETGIHPLRQAGMFGLLPQFLEGLGYRVKVRDDLPPEGVGTAASVLVVINPVRDPDPERIRSIRDFVRRGGALLVLGDHTDIFGTQGPLNRWCDPFGIRFRFDSARPASRGWEWSLETVPHPTTAGLDASNLRFRVGTGASLETRPPARALVLARYGFSDAGDRSNSGRGGFLGDYRWTGAERIGNIPLMAERRFGSGKVVALGDTSMFQNVALPFSLRFVSGLFRWLDPLAPAPGPARWREEIAAILV
ncbi:MAG: DUF4350 domain-containing protein, partial [Acidobacteria bacterium]|nr:DUF4350 domain-containing protein [Acidobacteriota bacterium]